VRCEAGRSGGESIAIDDEEVWQAHHQNKQSLITLSARSWRMTWPCAVHRVKILKLTRALNPDYLTIVYARRFAATRGHPHLAGQERLAKILTNATKPVQLIFAARRIRRTRWARA